VCLLSACKTWKATFSVVTDRNCLKYEWSFFISMRNSYLYNTLDCWGLETLLGKGANPGFVWWTCMCHRTSREALYCTKFHAKTFSTDPEKHLSWRHLSFGVWWCPPAAPASQHCQWSVLQPRGRQPTKRHISSNPHVSSPPTPFTTTAPSDDGNYILHSSELPKVR